MSILAQAAEAAASNNNGLAAIGYGAGAIGPGTSA
jgi:hypothetical protein